MASALYSEDLTCSLCLNIFTDPVNLPCGHSFCRSCITDALSSKQQCPQCRTDVHTEGKCLPASHVLKSLAEKAKEAKKIQKEHGHERAEVADLCPEHEEKLKLFCVTDQKLTCVICRDGEEHEGHKFKPIREAAACLRQELKEGIEYLSEDIIAAESQVNTQEEEIRKTKEKSEQLKTQIHRQFEEMHQFLRKREDEIQNELKYKEEDAVEKMNKMLKAIETSLSESRELQRKVTSVLKIEEPERFLKSWTEGNNTATVQKSFKPRGGNLQVVNSSLSLGPFESHLQFFVWKEMLQVIQPRAELLSFKSTSTDVTVSDDRRSLFCSPPSKDSFTSFGHNTFGQQTYSDFSFVTPSSNRFGSSSQVQRRSIASSVTEFTSGQHYWEIEIGNRNYWELGIKDYFLKYDGQKYATCSSNRLAEITFEGKPRKIGIYLDCSSKKLSFYDADIMTHIHTLSAKLASVPLSAYFSVMSRAPDYNPLSVCWY